MDSTNFLNQGKDLQTLVGMMMQSVEIIRHNLNLIEAQNMAIIDSLRSFIVNANLLLTSDAAWQADDAAKAATIAQLQQNLIDSAAQIADVTALAPEIDDLNAKLTAAAVPPVVPPPIVSVGTGTTPINVVPLSPPTDVSSQTGTAPNIQGGPWLAVITYVPGDTAIDPASGTLKTAVTPIKGVPPADPAWIDAVVAAPVVAASESTAVVAPSATAAPGAPVHLS